ncbi:MAG: RNA polymerase sigma factor, partial [Gemmatimonadetes bacterium]|nr:RNA polymerase sigma factor [Gemmatimonadota bacterium]NIR80545.1 RNA polymerase sigma factor [Gemmatimonadota bacterium]NIT86797.1 RNA polymerase sigma factor [Gemmatimonadota bacterium]NIU30667.1 RNA polymerase sigma factor [Gemmatimonadota bacterium]NIU37482.1 RNA polymerase sigma factor [Gemmatimonadota bacterium]
RKRLSRARRRLHAFLRGKCGLVDSENPCRCRRRVRYAIEHGRVDPGNLLFARPPPGEAGSAAWRGMEEVEALRDEAAVLKTNPEFQAPEDFAGALGELLRGERYPVITADPDGA